MTLCARLAAYFRDHAGRWIDGKVLAELAGGYAWRTRCSDLRKPPFGMTIENRQRQLVSSTGRTFKVSEYRYVPSQETKHLSLIDETRHEIYER
jgi:hypothetical protein